MKRHIFFIGTLCGGGAERVVSILASRMAEQEMQVEVLTYYDKPIAYEVSPKVKITAIETFTGSKNKLYNLLQIRKYFKKNAQVVISFLAPFNMMAIAANFGNGIPIIVADRNDPTKVPSNKRFFVYVCGRYCGADKEKSGVFWKSCTKEKYRNIQSH